MKKTQFFWILFFVILQQSAFAQVVGIELKSRSIKDVKVDKIILIGTKEKIKTALKISKFLFQPCKCCENDPIHCDQHLEELYAQLIKTGIKKLPTDYGIENPSKVRCIIVKPSQFLEVYAKVSGSRGWGGGDGDGGGIIIDGTNPPNDIIPSIPKTCKLNTSFCIDGRSKEAEATFSVECEGVSVEYSTKGEFKISASL
jgi:hypothetical protein